MSRPRTYTAEEINEAILLYIENEEDPTVAKFCLYQHMSKDTLYRYAKESDILSDSIKILHLKQEVRTIEKIESGDIPTAWGIFKMKQKQFGMTDKQEIVSNNTNHNINEEVLTSEERKAKIEALLDKKKNG